MPRSATLRMMRIALSAMAIAAAWLLLYFRVDPVPTWFYVFAWYPTLVLLDSVGTRLDGRPSALWSRSGVSLLIWSPVIWLVFEAANLRLRNWYYVFLPHAALERWTGIILSFATVVPALFLAERALDAAGLLRHRRERPVEVRAWDLRGAVALGIGIGALAFAFPQLFFPLIWGAAFLIADPFVYRRAPALSLIGDVARGDWGRIGRLMLGGLGIGLLWETYNFWAQGKWVYTVPWLEHTKLFEMPPFGFLGFPVFALEAWSMYSALCVLGVALPLSHSPKLRVRRLGPAAALAVVLSGATLLGMEQRTISSTVPRLDELPGIAPGEIRALQAAGIGSPFNLARTSPEDLVGTSTLDPSDARRVVEIARLVTLRGIGTRHAQTMLYLGLRGVCDLAMRDPRTLWDALGRDARRIRPTAAEVRAWVRAAARECER